MVKEAFKLHVRELFISFSSCVCYDTFHAAMELEAGVELGGCRE